MRLKARQFTSLWCANTDCTGFVGAGDRISQIRRY
uniref:Nfc103 n=1 Tax=Arundo donax TaxID=35708 RepID=A0A0A9EEF5_ARUDO